MSEADKHSAARVIFGDTFVDQLAKTHPDVPPEVVLRRLKEIPAKFVSYIGTVTTRFLIKDTDTSAGGPDV